MGLLYAAGDVNAELTQDQLKEGLSQAFVQLGERRRVLAIPPDFTRVHSQAGRITEMAWELLGDKLLHVLPALGTHTPMSEIQLRAMFGAVPSELFRVHNWREDVCTLGEVPGAFIEEVSEGRLNYSWPAEVNKLLLSDVDLILSIGQVVPHEVVGMANGSKNIFIGTGGPLAIHRSHFLGAVYGMERMMGRVDTPVRRILRYAREHFAVNLPIVYVQTVVGRKADGELAVRGLFISEGTEEAFEQAAALSVRCNFEHLPREIKKAVVFLDAGEYHSTWLGNKSVYRTRMALADDAELIVLAPGVKTFGEDPAIDKLIRRYGYRGTPHTLAAVSRDGELEANLSAAAHLIHGSSEGRFRIRYCPGYVSREEVEGVGYLYGDLPEYSARYNPQSLREGWNTVDGEEIFFVSNPGLGLWAYQGRVG